MSLSQTVITDEINNYLLNHFSAEDDFLSQLRIDAAKKGIPEISISPVQGDFMQSLLILTNSKNVLEIGSLAGYSAIIMARALAANGHLIAVEIEPMHADFIRQKTKEAGLDNIIEVVCSSGLDFLKKFKPAEELDFIFVDADKREYKEYFDLSNKFLRQKGIFAADNALAFGDIAASNVLSDLDEVMALREFNLYLRNRKDYKTSLITVGDGLLTAIKL